MWLLIQQCWKTASCNPFYCQIFSDLIAFVHFLTGVEMWFIALNTFDKCKECLNINSFILSWVYVSIYLRLIIILNWNSTPDTTIHFSNITSSIIINLITSVSITSKRPHIAEEINNNSNVSHHSIKLFSFNQILRIKHFS